MNTNWRDEGHPAQVIMRVELAKKDAEIAELATALEAMVNFVSIYSDGYYRLHDTEEFKGAKDLLKRIKNET